MEKALPPQQQAPPPRRERKQIRIRDPNQGGRDITDEIMSVGWVTPTPTTLHPEKKDLVLEPAHVQPSELHPSASNIISKKRLKYSREFLLRYQFASASMNKPEGLPDIPSIILDKFSSTSSPYSQRSLQD